MLSSDDKEKLLDNLLNIKELQQAFFMKINGQYYEWFDLLYNKNYFDINNENVDMLSLVKYINSVTEDIEKNKKIDLIKNIIDEILKNKYMDDFSQELVDIYIKLGNAFDGKLLKNILEYLKDKDYCDYIVLNKIFNYIITEPNLEEDFKITAEFLCESFIMKKGGYLSYSLFDIDEFIDKIKQYYFKEYIDIILEKFKKEFILEEYSTSINDMNVEVKHVNSKEVDVLIGDKSKKITFADRFDLEDKLKKIFNNLDTNELKKLVENLFSDYNCSYSLENLASFGIEVEGSIINHILNIINKIEEEDKINYLLNKLISNDCSIYKKFALELVKKKFNHNINKFLVDEIRGKKRNIDYIIRNDIFSGEIKSIFKLINKEELAYLQDDLIDIVEKGPYILYDFYDENYIIRWKQKRYKELNKYKKIKIKYDALKMLSKTEVELKSLSGITCGLVEQLSNLTEKEILEMSSNKLIEYMNSYKPKDCQNTAGFKEYSYNGEASLISNTIAKKPSIFLDHLDCFLSVKNYIYIYNILLKIEDIINNGNIEEYYILLIKYCNNYLDKIKSDTDTNSETKKEISKESMIKGIFSIVSVILRKIKKLEKEDVEIIDKFIESSELINIKCSPINNSDWINYLINSVQGLFNIVILDYLILLKENDSEYSLQLNKLKEIFKSRLNKYEKESLILIGWRFYYFCNIDEEWIENIVQDNINNENIQYFVYGFANCRVIEEKYYKKYYNLFINYIQNDLGNLDTHRRLIEYLVIGNIMGIIVNNNEQFIDDVIKQVNLNDIKYIISILSNINRYKFIEIKDALEKILFLWEKIVENYYENKEILKDSLTLVNNFKSINKRVLNIIKCILENSELDKENYTNYASVRSLYRYIQLLIENNINCEELQSILINCNTGFFNDEYIKIMRKINEINKEVFNNIKKEWLKKNTKYNTIQEYFINSK